MKSKTQISIGPKIANLVRGICSASIEGGAAPALTPTPLSFRASLRRASTPPGGGPRQVSLPLCVTPYGPSAVAGGLE